MSKFLKVLAMALLVIFLPGSIHSFDCFDIQVVCSSTLNQSSQYSIINIFDNDIKTCWAEGVSSDGSGSMEEDKINVLCDTWSILPKDSAAEMFICYFPFPPSDRKITKIRLFNGYGKSEELWKANNRLKRIGIEILGLEGEIVNNKFPKRYLYRFIVDFPDTKWVEINLKDYIKNGTDINYVENIKFYILDTYKGTKYNDTCISEIEFYNQDKKYSIGNVEEIRARYGICEDHECF